MPRLLLTSLTMPASPVWLAVLCPLPMCVRRARLLLWACLRSFVRLLRWPLRVRACVCVLACLRACVLACLRVRLLLRPCRGNGTWNPSHGLSNTLLAVDGDTGSVAWSTSAHSTTQGFFMPAVDTANGRVFSVVLDGTVGSGAFWLAAVVRACSCIAQLL